jgi:hypothetical protein
VPLKACTYTGNMYELSYVDMSRESALERYPLYHLVIYAIQSAGFNCLEIKDLKHGLENCGACPPQLFGMIYCQHIIIFGAIIQSTPPITYEESLLLILSPSFTGLNRCAHLPRKQSTSRLNESISSTTLLVLRD